ncbi:MAX gene-associated protein isoform X2 [Rana temporaria]|uniref:MAX gene-associated protein isoform X2 n=1 Tax=Rana temporaria TaxID=8407 RepID=UPI001AAD4383|nr:MAX gene-associated protein isoform X2 [Rana temporaria]
MSKSSAFLTIMEENKMPEAAPESGSKPPSTTPAYFVILHQSEGDEKEERILVANRDASAVAPLVQPGPHESKSNGFLSADCISGGITVTLDNNNMWNEFYSCSTEMVLTKLGRRMFPYCRYWISGMDPYQKYILAMDITPLDTHKYKWNAKWWEPGGKAEPHVLGRTFIHPESPSTGQYWMHQPVSFYKLKLTNNVLDQEGHIILHSMHRYLPRLHVIPADKAMEVIQLNGPDVHTFTFPQTEFFAVTAYQNVQITQLKIDCNPFAKGFREGTMVGRPPKEGKPKIFTEDKDSPGSKKLEHDDPESTEKRKESISLSEQSDGDTENESVNAKQELRSLSNSQNTVLQNLLLKLNQLSSLGDARTVTTPIPTPTPTPTPIVSVPVPAPAPANQPQIKIKEEPEDNYDYNKSQSNMGVQVKQEDSDDDVTDEYSHSDDDYPILERHFAQFSTKLHSDRKQSVRSPSGVAKAKLLKLEEGKMPVVYLESCSTKKTAENVSNSQEPALPNTAMQSIKQEECSDIFPSIITCKREPFSRSDEKRAIKRKIYADYAVPLNVRTSRGRRKKSPSASDKPRATKTPVIENGEAPIKKRRGRPPKNKGAKVGRPPKKKPPIETPQLFPDFKPDLEDVDGVLFVAFSSKEALDVHTGGKPKTDIPSPPPNPAVHVELTEEQQKIVNLETQLLVQLKAMKHRQVIHPALQQVGLKLNIVDHAMSIDLRYLGVELPLPYITSDSRWDNCGLSSEGLPFVSRTGKTTDYTKIKGWRDKFSTNPPIKSEAGSSETTLKNRSAFCSDELDEYLENEAKLIEDIRGTSQNETVVSTVSFQFPTKSASYVRTLDSVLKKQALQASSNSVKISKPSPPPQPVKKRKYTRRSSTPKLKLKAEPVLPSPVAWEKPVKSRSPRKPKSPKGAKLSSSLCVMSPVTSKTEERPPLSEDDVTVQPSGLTSGEESLRSKLPYTPFQSLPFTPRSTGISKVQIKLMKLEESAIYQGKPRTYVTEERAEIALSALLTVQGFLKKRKPSHKMISKRTPPCKNKFCRLGCICASLNRDERKPVHCRQEACMFGCDCVNGEPCSEKDGLNVAPTRCKQNVGEDVDTSTEDKHDGQSEKHTHVMAESSESQEEMEKPCKSVRGIPGVEAIGIHLGDSADSSLKNWSPKVFPIWDRSDVDNDPEPLCIPEKGEVFEGKPPYHRGKSERGKSSASKSSHLHTPRPAVCLEDLDSEDVQQLNSMTCARVRGYKPKVTEEKARKDQDPCTNSETAGKENSHKPNKYREREKENARDNSEVAEKRHKKTDRSNPAKLLNIISDCSREQDPQKILNIVSQQVDKNEPKSFRVGSLNIELTSDNKDGDVSKSSATSHVKISMAPDQKTDQVTEKPPSVKGKTEGIKLPEQIPLETQSENEIKSHGGKGLPFYSKVIPAGKLVAQLKNSTLNQSELIQVNGKTFPQAKLLLGQMGALHPANRIAAYITHRLRPNLLYLSKEASAKAAANNAGSESSTANENVKVATDGQKNTVASPQSNTVISPSVSTPMATLTSGLDKRLGPRLLLIPVSNGSAPVRPVPSVQTSPGQKMVLQPIKGPNGINLFRHPNGQIIQLWPLQSIQAANVQQTQRVVIHSPGQGPAVSVQLPLKTTTDDATTGSATTGSLSVPPTPALQTVSLSKISPVKSGVTVIPTSPSKIATIRIGTPPRASSEVSPSGTKVLSYTSSGCGVLASTDIPLRTGGLPVLKCSTTTALSSSPLDSAAKPKIILMTSKPAVLMDANKLTNYSFLKSAVIVSTSEKNAERENGKECKGISSLETDNAANMVKDQSGPKDSVTSAEQEVLTRSIKKMGETEEMSTIPSQIMVYGNQSKKSDIASGALLQVTNNQDSLHSLQKSSDGSTDVEAGSLSQTIIAESDCNVENSMSENAQDPANPAAKNAQEPENPAVENAQDPENTVSESDQDPENAAAKSDQDPKNPEAKRACIPLEQDNRHTVESTCSTVKVQTKEDSEVNQQTPNRSEQDEGDKDGKGDVVTDFPTINEQDENFPSDPSYNSSARESEQNSQSEDESEADDSIDIETVEEISEGINIAHLKATATPVASYSDKSTVLVKRRKMGSKVNGDDTFPVEEVDVVYVSHRKNHTANERKRRNEMRDLFEELRKSLGLFRLPKASKIHIIKKAIEEIEGLTDTADSLIKQKTLMSQKQSQLIKKVSNLSGKPKEVVMKKLEYLYAKQSALEVESEKSALEGEHQKSSSEAEHQKSSSEAEHQKSSSEAEHQKSSSEAEHQKSALEAESRKSALEAESKQDFVEHHTLIASVNKPPPPLPLLRMENKANCETSCSKTKKPIILARNHVLHSAGTQQPVVIPIPNLPRDSSGQLAAVKEAIVGQVAGIPPTLVSADVRPAQMPTGMASVVIQLPGTIQLKGEISNTSIPITLSAVSHTISTIELSSSDSENDDDLSMMPRIVNVTSLAEEASSDLYRDIMGFHTAATKADTDTEVNTLLAKETAASDLLSDQAERDLSSAKQLPSTSHLVVTTEEKLSISPQTQNSYSSLPENLPLAKVSIVNAEVSSESGKSALDNVLENVRDSELELELKQLSSAIEEADLDPNELSDVMADQEDETFSSLLNEIAFLNQQLNNDPSEMGCDFPAADTLSQESIGISADGNSSPFFFEKFKELSEPKEKNISLSPLFLQIDEGEIRESIKHSEEPGIVVFEDAANKEAMTEVGMDLLQPPANVTFLQAVDQPEVASSSDVFWRPMPKLAPLGLMSSNVPSDQRVLGNKSMPSLASAAIRLSLPKPMD